MARVGAGAGAEEKWLGSATLIYIIPVCNIFFPLYSRLDVRWFATIRAGSKFYWLKSFLGHIQEFKLKPKNLHNYMSKDTGMELLSV